MKIADGLCYISTKYFYHDLGLNDNFPPAVCSTMVNYIVTRNNQDANAICHERVGVFKGVMGNQHFIEIENPVPVGGGNRVLRRTGAPVVSF